MRDLTHRICGARRLIGSAWCHRDILYAQEIQRFRVLYSEVHILRNIAGLPRYLASIEF